MNSNKKFFRSGTDKIIAGVAGGLGNYFNIDPILIRITFLAFLLVGGVGVIVYVVLWITTPQEPNTFSYAQQNKEDVNLEKGLIKTNSRSEHDKNNRRMILGIVFIICGILLFFRNYLDFIEPYHYGGIALLVLGGYLIFKQLKSKENESE